MKTLLILFIAVSTCVAQDLKYEAQKKTDNLNLKSLNILSKIKLANVKLTKVHLSEAIFYLSKGAEKREKFGVFDFTIGRPLDITDASSNPFSESPQEKKKYDPLVSFNQKGVPILVAIDNLCKQAGYTWSASLNSKGKPFLTIEFDTPAKPNKQ